MKLSDKQAIFLKQAALLILYAEAKGWKVTSGELWRPNEMQEIYLKQGKTTVKYSKHQKKLAIDLNFFRPSDKKLTYKKEELQEIGDFWESLDSKNSWGGNWKSFIDTPHFERKE